MLKVEIYFGKEVIEMLPIQQLPAVPHLIFGIFNLSVPDLIVWVIVIGGFFFAAWLRLPKIFEGREKQNESDKKNSRNDKR
ncbi:hypothetical protein [Athalassotoga saccharophila]|uniref:hypothetical protein n=1 Tax=Athalassotoga saccharophila TaxID=1441386 RepID=UPI00137A8494|nr:hypothetical protein [Athalassotoga saccharophila]BBJ28471.1 hypothetical protein ATHSA_1384 [Athalassotoga saccharophila]